MATSENIRIGVIGAGTNTKLKHIPGLQAIEGVSVDVVCNRSEASSRKAADDFGIGRIASSWQEVIADDSIDAICIGTWPYLHAPITIAALEAGKHVLTEARMAMSAKEAEEMLNASLSRPDLVAQIVPSPFTLKWDLTIRKILESGELGSLREISVIKTLPMNANEQEPMNWRQNIEYSGNNTMMLGIYYEVVQRWIQKNPSRVWSHGRIFTKNRDNAEVGGPSEVEIPESLTFVADYEDGLQLTGIMSGIELGSGRDEYAISGAKGTIRLDLKTGKLYRSLLGEEEQIVEPRKEDVADWNVEADFIASIREGTAVSLTNFTDGLNYMKFTDAARTSFNAGGEWMAIS
jgi:predicted dehydrogenase